MPEVLSNYILSLLPEGFDHFGMIKSLVYIIAIAFVIAMLIRLVHQKTSQYYHALSSAMALMFMYLVLLQVRRLLPDFIDPVLAKLPLINFNAEAETVGLYQFSIENFSRGCREFLYLFILSFCLIGLDDIIPDARNTSGWLILQFVITCVAIAIYCFLLKFLDQFVPAVLNSYAPLVLVCILLFMVLLGLLKLVLTLVLVAVNPLLGAVSAFFSSNKMGMALGKSVMCSFVLTTVCIFMRYMDFCLFRLEDLTMLVFALPLAVLGLLWVVFGHIL